MTREIGEAQSVQGILTQTFHDPGERATYYHPDGTPTIGKLPATSYWVAYYKKKGFTLAPPDKKEEVSVKPKTGRPKGSKNKPKGSRKVKKRRTK